MSELSYAIDGGSVTIEDGVKAAEEYAPARKVSVTLNWTASEDNTPDEITALFDYVAAAADRKVAQLLGRVAPAAVNSAPAASTDGGAPVATRTRRTKEQIAADKAAEEAAKAPAAPAGDVSMDMEDTTLPPASSTGASDASADVSFDLDVEETPAREITDVDLNNAVQGRNKEINNPGKIKELISSYRADPSKPFNLVNIPQAQRQEFLDKLAALTA